MITSSQLKPNSKLGLIITEKIQIMGGSEPGQACKIHPYHDQKQGVCASCLRKRLAHLILVNTSQAAVMAPPSCSSSPGDPFSSASSSSHVSRLGHHRDISDNINNLGSISLRLSIGNRLKKSRSLAFVSRNHVGEVKNGKKNRGFWTKLLHLKGKKDQVLMRPGASMSERLYN
ncbi:hypothetical protein SADUNF_Sadunf07G0084200 [Salix dunnii]|uniref:Uncharacterized protein n=1 Tax=Salix dunnii TaxID=1413687 RepID=A0A835JWT2_9ROSI|nr:hypothetical protein SADUNF_Sadunf07G0084200 [Salix dunnii]